MKGFNARQDHDDAMPQSGRGNKFLTQAKADHAALFEDFAIRAGDEEFEDVDHFVEQLRDASWLLTEAISKQSYRNGIGRGSGERRRK